MAKRFIGGELVSSVAPAGSIQAFAGASVPDGWLLCDGEVYDISQFPSLAAALDGAWDSFAHPVDGTPSVGAGQFAVPNMKGLYLSGAGNAGGDARSLGVFQGDTIKYQSVRTLQGGTDRELWFDEGTGSRVGASRTTIRGMSIENGYRNQAPSADEVRAYIGDFGSNESRPKTAPVNYIIKY